MNVTTNAKGPRAIPGYLRIRFWAYCGNGKSKKMVAWARREGKLLYRKYTADGNKTNTLILLGKTDLISEEPAAYNLHYDEMELA